MISILFILFLTSAHAIADNGVTKFHYGNTSNTLYNGNIKECPFFAVTILNGTSKNYYPYPINNEFLQVRCENDKKGKDYLLINHFAAVAGTIESGLLKIKSKDFYRQSARPTKAEWRRSESHRSSESRQAMV